METIALVDRDSFLDSKNVFSHSWREAERHLTYPARLNKIVEVDFNEFSHNIRHSNQKYADSLVESLMLGDCYVMKNSLSIDYLKYLKDEVFQYFQASKSEFNKLYEGVPNYYRFIDQSLAGNYAFHQEKQVYYFFPFNEDKLQIFKVANQVWRVTKYLSGYREDIWESNTPKDGIIDRIQVVRYYPKKATLKLHTDPYLYQRFFISCLMSKKGVDYQGGGLHLLDKNNEAIDAEHYAGTGDVIFAIPTIHHRVDPCDVHKEPSPTENDGRWLLSLYSIMSDYIKDRHTSKPRHLDQTN